MKILVSCIPYDGGKSGISVYVREVVRALLDQGHELSLLCEPRGIENGELRIENFNDSRISQSPIPNPKSQIPNPQFSIPNSQFSILHAPRWTRRPAISMLWHLLVLPFWIRRRRRDFDGFVVCAANRRVCAFYPLPTVATVHDLANFHIPGKYSRLRMFYLAHILPFFAKRAQRLVAVSGATKSDMVKFWGCRDERVTVLYNGLSGRGTRDEGQQAYNSKISAAANQKPETRSQKPGTRNKEQETRNQKPETRNQKPETILYISRIEHPGKNHVRLIEAYSRLPREIAEAHPLVMAGADWKDAEIVHSAAAASPHSDLIRFTGFVDDIEKVWADAGFYVFPSLFEGFGLSLVEAMARGIPCACSNNGSLGEIAADVAVTFDPMDAGAIADALRRLLSEPERERADRIARGLKHVKRFSWKDHASGIVRLLEGVA